MLAVLFGAFAPAVSQAFATRVSSPDYIEICTAHGVQMLPVDGAPQSDDSDTRARSAGHCAWCLSHLNPVALPPSAECVVAVLDGHDVYPPLYYRAPRPLQAWIAANPRAPPVLVS